jgi:hypothetical protein
MYAPPAMKSLPHMLSKWWNMFHIFSASYIIRSMYAQHILNDDLELGCDFPLCWARSNIGYLLAEHVQKLVTHLAEHSQKLVYLLVEHTEKSFRRTTCIFRVFLLYPLSLSNVLCPLSHVFVVCLQSYVPCLTSLFLVYLPRPSISRICFLPTIRVPNLTSLFLVSRPLCFVSQLCSLSYVIFSLSPILLSLSPNHYYTETVPLFHYLFFARICTYKVAHV